MYDKKCRSYDKSYIGQTERSCEVRMGEHKRSFNLKDGKSNYDNHFSDETSHNYNDDFIVLHVSNKGAKLNTLEALQINKQKWKGNFDGSYSKNTNSNEKAL